MFLTGFWCLWGLKRRSIKQISPLSWTLLCRKGNIYSLYLLCLYSNEWKKQHVAHSILPLFWTTESVCLFLDSISLGTVKVKISDADVKVIEQFIGRKNAIESCEKKERRQVKQVFEKPRTIIFRIYLRPFHFLEPGSKSLKGLCW